MSSIIQFDHVHYKYPGDEKESLCGISLSIEEGSFVKGAPKNNKSTNEVKDVTSGINKNNAIDVDTKDKEDD